jgi:hypothetical protein
MTQRKSHGSDRTEVNIFEALRHPQFFSSAIPPSGREAFRRRGIAYEWSELVRQRRTGDARHMEMALPNPKFALDSAHCTSLSSKRRSGPAERVAAVASRDCVRLAPACSY